MKKIAEIRRRGVALVIVLCVVMLITILVVAFFSATQLETRSTSVNRSLKSLQPLAELPLEIVKTQLRSATTLGQTNSLALSTNTWASQPGLLRVFSDQGSLVRAFKLYSSSTMDTNSVDFIGSEIPANWRSQTNRWVDLNEPYRSLADTNRIVYPIFDPTATNWAEGVSVTADPSGQNTAAMPAEWLYVLPDGEIVSQDNIPADKPPVGRISFWTDDETAKININTAGERTMWDRPRAWHEKRNQYAKNQPSTGEYNAYPGHPATVSLSSVFGKALNGVSSNALSTAMLGLTPRYRWGGSENGTLTIWDARTNLDRTTSGTNTKNDRLYATTSELIFGPDRSMADSRLLDSIEGSDFLLTDSSRAPELNVFGLPRVGLWPIDSSTAKRTTYDSLIARCLTIGSKAYYFQRSDPLSSDEGTSIARNWSLLQYLDSLTTKPVSGFGHSFDEKWGTDERRQILTEMFDYVRAGVNLSDTSRAQADYSKQFTPAFNARRGFVIPTRIKTGGWDTRGLGRAPTLTHVGIVFYAYKQSIKDPATSTTPQTYNTDVNALLWFNFFSPMQGLAPYSTTYRIRIKSSNFAIKSQTEAGYHPVAFNSLTSDRFTFPRNNQDFDWGGYDGMILHGGTTVAGFDVYEFQTTSPISLTGSAMDFQQAHLELEVVELSSGKVLQTYAVDFPASQASWPVPLLWAGTFNSSGVFDPGSPSTATTPNPYNPMLFNARNYKLPVDSDQLKAGVVSVYNLMLGHRNPNRPPVDVIRTMEIKDGDARLIAASDTIDATQFAPGYGYNDNSRYLTGSLLYSRKTLLQNDLTANNAQFGKHVNATFKAISNTGIFENLNLPRQFNGKETVSLRDQGWAGDYDNGFLGEPDGPYANKPDEGHTLPNKTGALPYDADTTSITATSVGNGQRLLSWDPRLNGFFSPTRQIPSAVMFGSLPTTVKRTAAFYKASNDDKARPWETLLFCPNSQATMVTDGKGAIGHPGEVEPRDHLLLDLFTMPVVEPYAISEPFSTAGKINLNQRIIPFTYIQRETGLYGLMKNLEFTAVKNTDASIYRSGDATASAIHQVDVAKTVAEIGKTLDPSGKVGTGAFRSASQICDVLLIPTDLGGDSIQKFWSDRQLTGDNTREAPYNYIYPLLTTKSNTYQIHYRVQSLKALSSKTNFNPQSDFAVTGEQRGSYLIERYLDANDSRFSGSPPQVDPDSTPLNEYYKVRVLRNARFILSN